MQISPKNICLCHRQSSLAAQTHTMFHNKYCFQLVTASAATILRVSSLVPKLSPRSVVVSAPTIANPWSGKINYISYIFQLSKNRLCNNTLPISILLDVSPERSVSCCWKLKLHAFGREQIFYRTTVPTDGSTTRAAVTIGAPEQLSASLSSWWFGRGGKTFSSCLLLQHGHHVIWGKLNATVFSSAAAAAS